ncbi:MAG: hypothetical protein JWR26_2486 [Pedosphaera sp.]|nr:hypothetical protein [Pedosphaera sp.]
MKTKLMKTIFLTAALWAGAMCAAAFAAGAPKLQFNQTLYDFGKTSQVETVSGVFKFKNVGDDILKLEPPKPSCGCTVASLTSDTLKPGESGELAFTLNLGRARATMEKHISVKSNDPLTPEATLSITVDYTPLYDITPMTLAPNLAFGVDEIDQYANVTRTDGKPLHILKLDPSKPWITAKMEAGTKGDASTARIHIIIQRDGPPRRYNEYVHVYVDDQTNINIPTSTIYLYGQVMGEVSVSPESLYWSVTDAAQPPGERPEALVVRRLTVRSADGKIFEMKNAQSTIPGIHVEVISKESGKAYELVAKLNDMPTKTVSGTVSFETSVAAQPRMEIPVIVNVFKP